MDNAVQPMKTNEKKMEFDLKHNRQILVLRIFSSFAANNMNYVVFHKSHMLL